MDDTEKLTFENVNKIKGIAGNLIKWLKAELEYDQFVPKVEQMQKRLSELNMEFNKMLIYNTLTTRYYIFILQKTACHND